MPITFTPISTVFTTVSGTTALVSTVWTPTSGVLYFLALGGFRTGIMDTAPLVEGNGCTWVRIAQAALGSSDYFALYRARPSAPAAGGTSARFTTNSLAGGHAHMSIVEAAGASTASTDGAGAIVQAVTTAADNSSGVTANLAPFADTANNQAFAAGYGRAAHTTGLTTGSGFTLLTYTSLAGGSSGSALLTQHALNTTVVNVGSASTHLEFGVIAVEVAVGAVTHNLSATVTNTLTVTADTKVVHELGATILNTFTITATLAVLTIFERTVKQFAFKGQLSTRYRNKQFNLSVENGASPRITQAVTVTTARSSINLLPLENVRHVLVTPSATNTHPFRLAETSGEDGLLLSSVEPSFFSIQERSRSLNFRTSVSSASIPIRVKLL